MQRTLTIEIFPLEVPRLKTLIVFTITLTAFVFVFNAEQNKNSSFMLVWKSCHFCKALVLVLMSLKVFECDLYQLLFILKLATFLEPLEVLYLHNVYYLKLSLIILIYYVTFTDLIFEKGFMKVENVRIIKMLYELK